MADQVRVKICGVTSVADAELCVKAGADAVGLNFCDGSPRRVDARTARAIVDAVGAQVVTVGVFANASAADIEALRSQTGFRCVQLHGEEPPELLAHFLPHAYKAIAVRDEASIEEARCYPGEHVLLDAFVPGQRGGTGRSFNWQLAASLAKERSVTLAGGLNPENVARAVVAVRPFCVDVASGVESCPGSKDAALVRSFVAAAKGV